MKPYAIAAFRAAFLFSTLFILFSCEESGSISPSPSASDNLSQPKPIGIELDANPLCLSTSSSSPFIAEVISYQIGPGGGFHWKDLPQIILGPPQGTGTYSQSEDVFSLGERGEMIIKMAAPIIDQDGPDFIVFENPFYVMDNPENVYAEPAEISVSADGKNFVNFSCESENWQDYYPGCAGIKPVFANGTYNAINPQDVNTAGGDIFDLKDIGVQCALYIKIRDATPKIRLDNSLPSVLDETSNQFGKEGFDLDAISIIHKNK